MMEGMVPGLNPFVVEHIQTEIPCRVYTNDAIGIGSDQISETTPIPTSVRAYVRLALHPPVEI